MEILRVEDLGFSYRISPDKKALDGVSFSLGRGDMLCVCGATGGGKSTLLKLLKRELVPAGEKSGKVLVCGKSTDETDERESASTVGFVMQRPEQQIVTDKVWHELAFGLENLAVPRKEIRRRVSEIAGYFGIESWFERSTDELSGGHAGCTPHQEIVREFMEKNLLPQAHYAAWCWKSPCPGAAEIVARLRQVGQWHSANKK